MKQELIKFVKALPHQRVGTLHVDLTTYSEEAENLIAQAKRAEVTDADSYAKGGDLISIARARAAKAEDHRTELVGPYNKMVKFINAAFKVPKEKFTDARSIVETKMMMWKRAEDEKLRKAAEEERKKLEAEALERAAAEKTEEAQDEVLDAAAEAGEEVIEKAGVGLQRGDYGSSTGTRKTYTTNIISHLDFLRALVQHIDAGNKRNIDLGAVVDLRKSGLNKLAEDSYKAGVRKMPGAEFVESEKIRVY